jgi:hypothetical protein
MNLLNLLVLVTDYPKTNGSVALMYVHIRNKYYLENNINVTVLNFNSKDNYLIDGINVITYETYKSLDEVKYDFLVCHAPNIKNHYKFLRKYEKKFNKIVFFFHGHEVVRLNKIYPVPYDYTKKYYMWKRLGRDLYDTLKLKIWRNYFSKLKYKSHFIFVSNMMYKDFLHWTNIKPSIIKGKYSIIYNSVSKVFEENMYDHQFKKIYDYITIRSNLDSAVYCIDIVISLAKKYIDKKFLIIGEGKYFDYNEKPNNVILIKKCMQHQEMLKYINLSKCALMPTRRDTQGVMSCELATYGIPLITSDINVCYEVFSGFENVKFINNENMNFNLDHIANELIEKLPIRKPTKYYQLNTSGKEIELFKRL